VKQLPNTRGKKATAILCLESPEAQGYSHSTEEEEYGLGATALQKSPELLQQSLWDSFHRKKKKKRSTLHYSSGSH